MNLNARQATSLSMFRKIISYPSSRIYSLSKIESIIVPEIALCTRKQLSSLLPAFLTFLYFDFVIPLPPSLSYSPSIFSFYFYLSEKKFFSPLHIKSIARENMTIRILNVYKLVCLRGAFFDRLWKK